MLDADIIDESDSMWQSPVVMVKKKNGQLRFAVDYRKLSAVTKQFTFPLPRLEDVFTTPSVPHKPNYSLPWTLLGDSGIYPWMLSTTDDTCSSMT